MNDVALGIAVGVGLAAATGLRAFVPLLATSVAARAGWLALAPGMEWIASDAALLALAAATVLEVLAYSVPWLDNLLDSLATPTAVLAGVLVTAAAVGDLPPLVRWALAIVLGGGTAGVIQMSTVLLRLASSVFSGGLTNPLLALLELAGALIVSLLALAAPLVGLVVVAFLLLMAWRRVRRGRAGQAAAPR